MTQRTPSPVDAIAEDYFHRFTALVAATPVDDIDRVTIAAMRERLGLAEEIYAAGLDELDCNVLASPMQSIRSVFDLMDTSDDVSRTVFAVRLTKVAPALEQWTESLAAAAAKGLVPARRQVLACITQCEQFTSDDGYFAGLVDTMSATEMSPELRVEMEEGIREAAAAYVDLGTRLREQVLPTATETDAVGRERYSLFSRYFLGSTVDLEETYRWGQEELARIEALRADVADQIMPGSTPAEAIAYLDTDARFRLDGVDALREWLQARGDEAIAELADTHFDIPGPVRVLEGMIAPTQTGGIYYTGPSDDFSRPGRMWWSVPKGVTEFSTWRELTTVYHEGVPGHHLQVAQTVYRKETLNKWRRLSAWTSGHGEGWALYAERLMDELGYFAEPGNRMGWLDGQSLRAARVVIDIGVHCGFPAPAEVGGGEWDYDKAWTYLTSHANMDEAMLRFELDRYLGWPGQASSYKIGERLWLQLRGEARAREGDAFDLKDFHRRALDIGGVGLDTLRAAVLGTV